ncbi:MAG: hypothetical protein AB8G23_11425 [Myxococcota bacterium]
MLTRSQGDAARFRSWPADGAVGVPVGIWPELEFENAAAAADASDPTLRCDAQSYGPKTFRLRPKRLIIQPSLRLPESKRCELTWNQAGQPYSFAFTTGSSLAVTGGAARVRYRKGDPDEIAPIPDDFWTRRDPTSPTGRRLDLPVAVRGDIRKVISGLAPELARLDGWSPVAPIVLQLTGPLDPATLPLTAAESVDPAATVALVDIDPSSAEYGERWPFEIQLRSDSPLVGLTEHAMWVMPARPLRPRGHYALLLRRGVSDASGRAMDSPVLLGSILKGRALGASELSEDLAEQLVPAMTVASSHLAIPWTRDDLVFALTFTVGSQSGIERDPEALREAAFELPGPRLIVDRVVPAKDPERPLMATLYGRFKAPRFREAGAAAIFRDRAGRPTPRGFEWIDFRLALPWRADRTPAPVLIYQHGNPGSAEAEIGAPLGDPFLAAGFAVIGFTDLWNREGSDLDTADRSRAIATQVLALTESVRDSGVVPDDWIVTLGEQLALVAALRERGAIDVLPLGAPDGVPDLDREAPLVYEGISQGAIHGQALLTYAPEIRAASLVTGGARWAELPLHQAADTMVEALPVLFGDFSPMDLWVTMSLFQAALDRQDAHVHALMGKLAGALHEEGPRGPSVLLTAGLGDGYVPNRLTRSLAWVLGPLPWIGGPGPDAIGFGLPFGTAPLRANLEDGATGGYVELVPSGRDLPAAPGCRPESLPIPIELLREGHFCAQLAEESIRRRVTFLRSAIEAPPALLIDPFAKRTRQENDAVRSQ